MSAETEKNARERCTCGSFAISGTGLCSRCRDLETFRAKSAKLTRDTKSLEKENRELQQCRVENRKLISKVQKWEKKTAHPCYIHIKGANWDVSEEYLRKFIGDMAKYADILKIEWGYYKDRKA